MCSTDFNYILIGEDKMILCREADFTKVKIQEIIRKAFPGLFENIIEMEITRIQKVIRLFLPDLFENISEKEKIPIKVESCYKMFSSMFDVQVGPLEKENDWEKNPFIALWIFVKEGATYCGAKPVTI